MNREQILESIKDGIKFSLKKWCDIYSEDIDTLNQNLTIKTNLLDSSGSYFKNQDSVLVCTVALDKYKSSYITQICQALEFACRCRKNAEVPSINAKKYINKTNGNLSNILPDSLEQENYKLISECSIEEITLYYIEHGICS